MPQEWRFFPRSDAKGLKQCLPALAVSCTTGALAYLALRLGPWWLALLALVIHGNVCSLWISAVHELSHGTVFATARLNRSFARLFGFLNWNNPATYMDGHRTHHTDTLGITDQELSVSCRPLWFGSWVWSATINLPRLIFSIIRAPLWIQLGHGILALLFVVTGHTELLWCVTLAPFLFGWLELALSYPQHAGMETGAEDLRESTRSMRLPAWLSFLYWRMEYHLEHHLHPSVPCYHLPALHEAMADQLPARETLTHAWRSILSRRLPGECGHGPNPIDRIVSRLESKV